MTPSFAGGLILLSLLAAACSAASASCDFVSTQAITSVLGENSVETFSFERLDECVFSSEADPDQRIEVRVETVPDAQIFIEHAIEATDPSRVETLDNLGEGAVLFQDEAVLGRIDNLAVLVTGTVATEELVPVLDEALVSLEASARPDPVANE